MASYFSSLSLREQAVAAAMQQRRSRVHFCEAVGTSLASVRRSQPSENSSYRQWTQGRRTGLPKEAKTMSTKKRKSDDAHSFVQRRSHPISHEPRDAVDEMESAEVPERSSVFAASVDATEYANEFDESDLPTGDWS
jgi:hypothetical protein